MSNSLWPHGLYSPWNSPGQNTGMVAFPFSRVFPNPGTEPTSPALKVDSSQGKLEMVKQEIAKSEPWRFRNQRIKMDQNGWI